MDLATDYLGLRLPHPFVAGASPLSDTPEHAVALAEGGAAAIVLRSLFEEQIDTDALAHHQAVTAHADAHGEALSYFPEPDGCVFGPDAYLDHLRDIKAAVAVPVIASLNGYTPGGWLDHARQIEQAGADALELNLYLVATDAGESSAELEEQALAMVRAVRQAIAIPIAVKLSPFYTSLANFALRLQEAGADALVLFNRFFETDLDIEALEVKSRLQLSTSHELLLRLRWLAILSGTLDRPLAVSGGIHSTEDAIKAIMCGASAVQVVSALLRRGPRVLAELQQGLRDWLEVREYPSLGALRGSMDLRRTPDPKAFERANYMRILQTWRVD